MKAAPILLAVALMLGGMTVVGAVAPDADPAPSASAHVAVCSPFGDSPFTNGTISDCVSCVAHERVFEHHCGILIPMPQ